ncbi:phosphoheptose isomerase [Geoalkalibacter ferrihydriticus]|uniref:Phosphoheptose isomerase n=2 Tax=Geoalkalibacter ferrihydriticus TaxID=392333 RepID=A0A0C2EB17_9BACT|nr:D-sedoheptulose 7-phosphate isomerase [Geoalkalibacter ferrihydriticus]KIH75773.1 phosphoheptose isomerase [Geoalkalibacter ferrihydriticus DSM 17813]SDM64434.1 phosphoheptose isomerase [Geoalkalibacter ferrihydriticus]
MEELIKAHFTRHADALEKTRVALTPAIVQCVELIASALRAGNKVLIMGNGGSAADAQHFAAELVGRFLRERRALPAIALTTDTSLLTAVANDFGFDQVFKRQVEALARPGDVVIGLSTSGNSENVASALREARVKGCATLGLLGRDGGCIAPLVDLNLTVPVQATPHIQEAHITIIHLLCDLVERQICQEGEG